MIGVAACAVDEASPEVTPSSPSHGHLSQAPATESPVTGHWYLNRDGERLTVTLEADDVSGALRGTSLTEAAGATPLNLADLIYDPAARRLQYRTVEDNQSIWHRLQILDGIATGRYARSDGTIRPTDPLAYQGRLSAWRDEAFSAAIVPRVYDIALPDGRQAMLRIDRAPAPSGDFIGQLSFYALDGKESDDLAEDVDVQRWDGETLTFVRAGAPRHPRYTGTAAGRLITGTVAYDFAAAPDIWSGERAEVLTHGSSARPPGEMRAWQVQTRARLEQLLMAGNPAPLTSRVEAGPAEDPIPQLLDLANRDDSSARWPQRYQLTELRFHSTLPDPAGGTPLAREGHGYLAVPTTPPPPGGYPVALAVNGHWGSAMQLFDPQNFYYWYGDAFARRGYVVVAVDMGHRPYEDRFALYADSNDGDDPFNGNGTHPAIRPAGITSDFEEDGERVWDAMRALDYVLARPDVNPARLTVAGLSMGGEVSDWVGAMDQRVAATVAAGSPPDLSVMSVHGNHACWRWQRAEIREYVDPGDLHALVAGRTLIRETGRKDPCYSFAAVPFATAKQVVRRAQPAFDSLGGKLVHYLHDDVHDFHVGERVTSDDDDDDADDLPSGLTTPAAVGPDPSDLSSQSWQDDARTVQMAGSIFDILP